MENPWFGRTADGSYVNLPLTWQGWLVSIICVGGAIAARWLLPHPLNSWAPAACILAFLVVFYFTYDPDTESY